MNLFSAVLNAIGVGAFLAGLNLVSPEGVRAGRNLGLFALVVGAIPVAHEVWVLLLPGTERVIVSVGAGFLGALLAAASAAV